MYDAILQAMNYIGYTFPIASAYCNGAILDVTQVQNYGFYSNPPKGCHAFVITGSGEEGSDNPLAFIDDVNNRPKWLPSGDVAVYNPVSKSYVWIKSTGEIVIDSKGLLKVDVLGTASVTCSGAVTLTAPSVSINSGAVTIGGSAGAGSPIARVGDTVVVGGVSGTITSGGVSKAV